MFAATHSESKFAYSAGTVALFGAMLTVFAVLVNFSAIAVRSVRSSALVPLGRCSREPKLHGNKTAHSQLNQSEGRPDSTSRSPRISATESAEVNSMETIEETLEWLLEKTEDEIATEVEVAALYDLFFL